MSNQTFTKEKIIAFTLLSKDLITDSYVSIPDYLSNLFWDSFRKCILSKKALPIKEPNITLDYSLQNLVDFPHGDDNLYYVRIVVRALRLKTRGRRSVQFYTEQLNALAEYKETYISIIKDKINTSGILQTASPKAK